MPSIRVVFCGLATGAVAALLFGVSLGTASTDDPHAGVTTSIHFTFALLALILGGTVGCVVGELWSRRGIAGAVGALLAVAIVTVAGVGVAAFAGAETHVTVTENSRETTHGAPGPVLLAGAIVGLLVGGIVVWRFAPLRPDARAG